MASVNCKSRKSQVSIGQHFGNLIVVALGDPHVSSTGKKSRRWRCRCTCGRETLVRSGHLNSGSCTSCGCLKGNIVHGMKDHPEYVIWKSMKQRCHNKRSTAYPDYGGRGIHVCTAWRVSFATFLSDVGPRPSLAHQLDRIDNDRGYEPGNVRWTTPQVNCNNTRRNRKLTWCGTTLSLSQWARLLNMNVGTLKDRLDRGWSTHRALTTPPTTVRRVVTAFGESKTLTAWSRDSRCNVGHTALFKRIREGMDPETAITAPPYSQPT